jgi:acetyltransferase
MPAAPLIPAPAQARQKLERLLEDRRQDLDRSNTPFVPAKAGTRRQFRQAALDSRLRGNERTRTLNEIDSKALLRAYGVRTPREGLARSEREAIALAARIGHPVVAKAVSAALAHKSDAGGVILGLQSAKTVREACRRMTGPLARRLGPLDGILIAEQMTDGIELVLGVHRDPDVGPVILFGSGGVDLELVRDVALAPPPLDERAASELIGRTRAGQRIAGFRGAAALDRNALVRALIALSRLALDAGERIESIDINPFLLRRRGGFALDALVVLSAKS